MKWQLEGLFGEGVDFGDVPAQEAEPFVCGVERPKDWLRNGMELHRVIAMVYHSDRAAFFAMVPINWNGKGYRWVDIESEVIVPITQEPNWDIMEEYGFLVCWDLAAKPVKPKKKKSKKSKKPKRKR